MTILETPQAPPTLFFKAMGALIRLVDTQHRISRRPRGNHPPPPLQSPPTLIFNAWLLRSHVTAHS